MDHSVRRYAHGRSGSCSSLVLCTLNSETSPKARLAYGRFVVVQFSGR